MPPRHCVVLATALVAVCSQASAIVITLTGTAYGENFDSLASSGSTGSALPASWSFLETSTNANSTYGAGTGSSATGNTYSFGSSGSSERALGGLRTGTLVTTFGVQITNETGFALDGFDIGFTGEQWRLGALGRADRLDFQFSADASSLSTGSWTDFDSLDFIGPTTSGLVGLLDGNAAANRTSLGALLSGFTLANGASLWLRWSDFDAAGSDDGLAIDDFQITANRALPSLTQSVPDSLPMAAAFGIVMAGLAAVRRCVPVQEHAV